MFIRHSIEKEGSGKWQDEEIVRICAVLDGDRYVYHDAPSESCLGRGPDGCIPSARIPAFLLLTYVKKPGSVPDPGFSVSFKLC